MPYSRLLTLKHRIQNALSNTVNAIQNALNTANAWTSVRSRALRDQVNYSERLLQLVREARLVEQLGVPLPARIKEAVASGQQSTRLPQRFFLATLPATHSHSRAEKWSQTPSGSQKCLKQCLCHCTYPLNST